MVFLSATPVAIRSAVRWSGPRREVQVVDVRSGSMPSQAPPPHPGWVLLEVHLKPNQVLQKDAALRIGLDPAELSRFIHGHRRVDAKLAIRLAASQLGGDAPYWLALQDKYDLWLEACRLRRKAQAASPEQRLGAATRQAPLPAPSFQPSSPARDGRAQPPSLASRKETRRVVRPRRPPPSPGTSE